MNEQIKLLVNDKIYTGWKTATITKSIDSCSGSFSFTIIPAEKFTFNELQKNAKCTVYIDDIKLIDGFIDQISMALNNSSVEYKITGRDKTCDIIDSEFEKSKSFSNKTLLQLVSEICKPFNISVTSFANFIDHKSSYVSEAGETFFEFISKAAKSFDVLLVPSYDGNLIIGKPATTNSTVDSLVYGKNLLTFDIAGDYTNRFNKYIVKGDAKKNGNPWGNSGSSTNGIAYDEEVRTTRVKVFKADSAETQSTAKNRAAWEATTAASKSEACTASVVGFYQSNGALWEYNKMIFVDVNIYNFSIKDFRLISSVTYTADSSGMITIFTLKRPDTYKQLVRHRVKRGSKKIIWK